MSTFYEENQILQTFCRYELIRDNKKLQEEVEDFQVRLYKNREIDEWLSSAGFKLISRYGDYNHRLPSENDDMIIYECTKIGP